MTKHQGEEDDPFFLMKSKRKRMTDSSIEFGFIEAIDIATLELNVSFGLRNWEVKV